MDDQALLKALGEIVREKSGEPDGELAQVLSRYQRGQLSEAELDSLRSELAGSTSFDRVHEAMRPVSESFRVTLQSAIEEQIRLKKPSFWAWLGRWQVLTAAVGCAMVIFVVMVWSQAPQADAFPSYEFTVTGVVKQTRHGSSESKSTQPNVVHPFKQGAQATFTLRPFETVADPVEAVVLLLQAGQWRRLSLPSEVDARGAVRIVAEVGGELNLSPGEHTLWIGIVKKDIEISFETTHLDSLNRWPHFVVQIRVLAPEEHP